MHASAPDAIVHWGFGLGVVGVNDALADARLGPAAVHGDVVGERLHERRDLPCPPRLDRPRAVRREQRGGAALPRPLRRGPRSPTRIHHADLRPRRRPGVRRRARAGRTALAAGRHGGAGAGEDAAGRVRGAGHPDLVRQVDPTRLDGRRLPGRPRGDARLREHSASGDDWRSFRDEVGSETLPVVSCSQAAHRERRRA